MLLIFIALIMCQCDTLEDRSSFLIFKDTKAWNLAKAVRSQNILTINKQVKEYGVSVDFEDPVYGETVLHLAVKNNLLESVKALLSLGANPNHADNHYGQTVMHNSVGLFNLERDNDTFVLSELLKFGGSPNLLTAFTNHPNHTGVQESVLNVLCQYARKGTLKLELLIKHGADINYVNEAYHSPLFNSINSLNFDKTIILLQHGADYRKILFKDNSGKQYLIQDLLKFDLINLDSEDFQWKKKVVQFLEENGIDYRNAPVPPRTLEMIKSNYPNDWEEYLKKF